MLRRERKLEGVSVRFRGESVSVHPWDWGSLRGLVSEIPDSQL